MTVGDTFSTTITSTTKVKLSPISYSTISTSLLSSSKGMFLTDDDDVDVGSSSKSYFMIPDNQSLLYSSPSSSSCLYYDESSFYHHVIGFTKRLIHIYLSSPMLLMIVPLIIGILIGVFIQNMILSRRRSYRRNSNKEISLSSSSKKINNVMNIFQIVLLSSKLFLVSIVLPFISTILSKLTIVSNKEDDNKNDKDVKQKEENARCELQNNNETKRECNINIKYLPKHIAVIMDGNRRYGKIKYNGNITKGHWDGSKKLLDFCNWCLVEQIQIVTVFAFSTENWSREQNEISSLMTIFCKYCDELRVEAIKKGIKIHVLTTDDHKLPDNVKEGMKRMENETSHCNNLILNVCMSYGSRSEITHACQKLTYQYQQNQHKNSNNNQSNNNDANTTTSSSATIQEYINEQSISKNLLTSALPDPDILIRTSGEMRLSNFLLWQCAYSEIFFLDCHWPEICKNDLIKILTEYGFKRQRRFGK